MSHKIYSYLTLPESAVQLDWSAYDMVIPENGVIKQWRKNRDLEINVYMLLVQEQLKATVAPGSVVSINFCWYSPQSRDGSFLHGCAHKIMYSATEEKILEISEDFTIDGSLLAGSVQLSCVIVVEHCPENYAKGIYAYEPGSIIYESSIMLHLEGTQALFPVVAVDFHNMDEVAQDSLYFLKKRFSQLDSNFSSAYKLYFNSTHPLFFAINSDNEKDLTAQYLLKLIMYDVYRTIVTDALSENGLQEISYNENDAFSLKSIYSKIIIDLQSKTILKNRDLDTLKSMMSSGRESDRNAIFTAVQEYVMGGTV